LREAKQAAEDSKAQYELIVSMISDIVWRYDVNAIGEHVGSYISPVADRMLGLPDGTIGNSVDKYFSYVHPDDLPAVQEILSEGIRTLGKGKTAEYRLRKADGTTIWVRSRGSAYSHPDGRVTVFGTTSDITERKKAEETLRESEDRYRTVFSSACDGIILQESTGRILTWNKTAERVFGINAEEALGHTSTRRDWRTIREDGSEFPGAEHPSVHTLMTGEPCKNVVMGVRNSATDQLSWINVNTNPIFKEGELKPYAVVISFSDITERKQAELSREHSLIRQEQLNLLQQTLLSPGKLKQKLKKITDDVVDIFGADFCRIWITSPGDLCEMGCIHAAVTEGPHVCHHRARCLRLLASSGRYTHTDGEVHRRVPFGCYKIGRVASGQEHRFLTNDVQNEPRVHNREWAKEIGLVSFAGYQLRPPGGDTLGVLALFSKEPITGEEDAQLGNLSNTTAQIIQAARVDEELRESLTEATRLNEDLADQTARANEMAISITNCDGWW
jgi:PAS domain S-box-containing protein